MPLCLRPFISNLSIKTTNLEVRKFDLDYVDPDPTIGDWGWAQRPFISEIERQYNAGLPVRIIVLKARQLGISTASEAVLFLWNFLHPGSNNLVIAHEKDPAENLFNMTKLYWDTWPHRVLFSLQYGTRKQLRWEGLNSQMMVATAKNIQGSRSATLHGVHASEVAFWPNPGELWTGLNNTIPRRHKTIAVLESTANGVGNWFHEKWLEAEAGDSEFVPMFFPWYRHPAYRAHTTLVSVDLDSEERDLFARMTADDPTFGAGLPHQDALSAVAWRRLEIPRQGGMDNFMQEFPSTPEEAFIVSGRPIFPVKDVQASYEPQAGLVGDLYRDGLGDIQFRRDPQGPLTVFKNPSAERRADLYMVAGDPSRTVYGDPGSIQVINRVTFEQVAVWNGHKRPHEFGQEMMLIGDFYHHAMLCPEVEGGGQGAISTILASNYGNVWLQKWADRLRTSTSMYGWSTNYQRKRWAIGMLQKVIQDGSLLLHDQRTVHELIYFTENEEGILGNSGGARHDDTVMALAIAVTASISEGPVIPSSAQHHFTPDIYTSELEDNIINLQARMRR